MEKRITNLIKVLFTLSVLFLLTTNVSASDDKGSKNQGNANIIFAPTGVSGIQGTNSARVTGTDKGRSSIKFQDPYNASHTFNTFAGTFKGTIDGKNANFYCIDLAHYIAYYKSSNPHEYTDDGTTPPEITYVLNNYYPANDGPGKLSDDKEAASVQLALWHFADGMDLNSVQNTELKNRAKAIRDAANANASGVTTPVLPVIKLNPTVQYLLSGNNGSFTVEVKDQDNNPLNGIDLTLSADYGTLSETSVTTNSSGIAGPITITQGGTNSSTITASTTVMLPQGTRYVHKIEADKWQKLVLATPTEVTREGQGLVNWYLQPGACDLTGLITFTQGGWGSPSNSVPGTIREDHFAQVFPSGLIVGNGFTLTLTSPSAVKNFLPQGGTPTPLSQNYTDPGSGNISVFAGQVVALAMNVYFDQAGKIGQNSTDLGNLVIVGGPMAGKSVFEVLAIAETALGGGSVDYSLSQINDVVTAINENFDTSSTSNEDCGECEGKATTMTLKYTGSSTATIRVVQKDGDEVYNNSVNANEEFTFIGTDKKGTLGTEITIYVNGNENVKIHTSCSVELKVGDVYGDFLLTAGASREGGAFCGSVNDGDKGYLTCPVQLEKIQPILECVIDNGNGTYTANFGYNNPNDVSVEIPIGNNNKFTGTGNQNEGQPTTFAPGRTGYYPNVAFSLTWDGSSNLVWTLNGKTSTATKNSAPCSEHIFFDKKWYDENGNLMNGLPDDMPSNYQILATSSLGTATGIYTNGQLVFTYSNNNSNDTNGLKVPVNGTYTVEEFNLPTGYSPIFGTGTFTAEVPGGYATNPHNGFDKYGLHLVKNQKDENNCVTSWTGDLGQDENLCEYTARPLLVNGSVSITPNPGLGVLHTTWKVIAPVDDITDNSTNYASYQITGDTSFTITGQWPGVRPTDTEVIVEFTVQVKNCDGNALGQKITKRVIWNTTVCPPPPENEADLSLVKSVDKSNPENGETIKFNIDVTNNGPKDATGVEVSDLLPDGVDYTGYSTANGTYNVGTGIWAIGDIANGETVTLQISAVVNVSQISVSQLDLGPATGWNVFVLKDLYDIGSDTEGKVAVGRNADFGTGYSIGDKLPNSNGAEDVLVVNKNLTFFSGRVYHGNVVYGKSTNLPLGTVSIDEGTLRKDKPIDFVAARNYLVNLSNQLKSYTTNGTTTYEFSELKLVGNDPFLNVFKINGTDLSSATNFVIDVPNGSVVVVNVKGKTIDTWSGGLVVTGTVRGNVLYNFYNANFVKISNIGIEGTVLAPKAKVNFVSGQHNGQMIAKYLTGGGQYNNSLFIGNIPVDTTIVNVAEITASDLDDPDSEVNNGNPDEDDFDFAEIKIGQDDLNNNGGGNGSGNGNGGNSQNWTKVGNFTSGEIVNTIANDKDGNILAGTWGGKIHRSNDNGLTWTRINEGMPVAFIWSIAVNSDGDIFVGTEKGVYYSVDNGATWLLSGITDIDVRSLALNSDNDLYAGTWGKGVYKSTDNGSTWTAVGLDNLAVNSVVVDSDNSVYAATFGFGIYKLLSGQTAWTQLDNGYAHIWALGIDSNDLLYAGTYGDGVYTSNDKGTTWAKVNDGLPAQFIYAITVDAADNVYLSSWANGIYSTSNNGLSWNSFGMAGYGVSTLMVNPQSTTLYAGTSDGAIFQMQPNDVTAVGDIDGVPTEFKLEQNYPNPFNPSTTIKFSVKDAGQYSIKIYNVLGELVNSLINQDYSPGNYQVTWDASNLTSGLYIYQLSGNNVNITKKMILMK